MLTRYFKTHLFKIMLLCFHSLLHAANPVWTFTPLTATTLSVPANSTATVQYLVTNQSPRVHVLSMNTITGITQDTTPGNCSNPFTLGYQQSCTLTLLVDGGALTGPIKGGPIVCQNNNPLQCYQPSQENSLVIESAIATYAYFTNYNNGTVTQCSINNENGFLNHCQQTDAIFNIPYGVTVNTNYAYVANSGDLSNVSQCEINPSTGDLMTDSCISTGNGFSFATSVATKNGYAFVENVTNNTVSSCTIDTSTGNLFNCIASDPEFNGPQAGMAFSGHYIYVPDYYAYTTISKCAINFFTGLLFNCNATGAGFTGPAGVGIYNGYAYIANYNNNTVSFCKVNQSSGELSNCTRTGAFIGNTSFRGPNGVGVYHGYIYIENYANSTVLRCISDATTGELTACISTGSSFDGPAGQVGFYYKL